MNARVEGSELVISIPLEKELRPSSTGKTLIVASTNGFAATDAVIGGKPVSVSVNAIIRTGAGRK